MYKPIRESIEQYTQKISTLKREEEVNLPAHDSSENLNKYVAELKKTLLEKIAFFNLDKIQFGLTWTIDRITQNNLILVKCMPVKDEIELRNKTFFHFDIYGKFDDFMNFLECFCSCKYLIKCTKCDLERVNEEDIFCKSIFSFHVINNWEQ